MVEFEIPGSVPSKKNSRNLFTRGGRIVNIPSKGYAAWHDTSALFVKTSAGRKCVEPVTEIILTFYVVDNRRRDLTNMAESVMDLLSDCGTIIDDSWQYVPKLTLILGGVCKSKPRCEVKIL